MVGGPPVMPLRPPLWETLLYLNFRQHREEGGHQAEQHVEADEELVDGASIRLCVEDEEQHHSSKGPDVVDESDHQQR